MPDPSSRHQNQHPGDETPITDTEHGPGDDAIRLPLAEETLEARIVERERGMLRIHRRVETTPIQNSVDLHRDRYVVDRVEMNELASERREPWYEGDALMVPVYEEVLVTETRLMLREVIHLRNAGEIEQVNVQGTLRRDVIEIETPDEEDHVSQPEVTGKDAGSAPE